MPSLASCKLARTSFLNYYKIILATTEEYGKAAVFEDLYGNLWDLIEPVN